MNKSKLLPLLFILMPQISWAKNACQSTVFTYKQDKKNINKSMTICKDGESFSSESCFKINCDLKKKIKSSKPIEYKNVGSPHFQACHNIGGIPTVGKILDKWKSQKPLSLSVCFDKKRQEFVDATYILDTKLK